MKWNDNIFYFTIILFFHSLMTCYFTLLIRRSIPPLSNFEGIAFHINFSDRSTINRSFYIFFSLCRIFLLHPGKDKSTKKADNINANNLTTEFFIRFILLFTRVKKVHRNAYSINHILNTVLLHLDHSIKENSQVSTLTWIRIISNYIDILISRTPFRFGG